MIISATVKNSFEKHDAVVSTNNNQKILNIPPKAEGLGSSVNGGELLFLALATCFCNDIYREAAKRNMSIDSVEVLVTGEFGGEGEPALNIVYKPKVEASHHSQQEIDELISYVDNIAEIHNTIRKGAEVLMRREI